MFKRILLAGILGGLAMFLWEGLAHMVLPLGEAGVKALPNEANIQSAIKDTVSESGFYYFPAPHETPGMTTQQKHEEMERAMEKARTTPTGIMIVRPQGETMVMPKLLGMQCVFDVLGMLLAALLLSWAALTLKSFGSRLTFVTLLGLFPTLAVELPLWNWYGFPTEYTLAQAVVHLVGFLAGGAVLAGIVKR